MNSTLSNTSAVARLESVLPSQAHELLEIERREHERVVREKESILARESALEAELASSLQKEERSLANDGMKSLQEFNQRDLTDFITKESAEIERQAASVKDAGLSHLNKAADVLVNAALSEDLLSHL